MLRPLFFDYEHYIKKKIATAKCVYHSGLIFPPKHVWKKRRGQQKKDNMPTTLEKIAEIEAEVRGRLERSQLYFTFLDGSYTKEQGHCQPSGRAEGETGQTASRIDTAERWGRRGRGRGI